MFILLARDHNAPALVDAWAAVRERDGEDPAKVREAQECADAMREWRKLNRPSAIAAAGPAQNSRPLIPCFAPECDRGFPSLDEQREHMRSVHGTDETTCNLVENLCES